MAPQHTHSHHHSLYSHHHHHSNALSSTSFAPYSIPNSAGGTKEGSLQSAGPNHSTLLSSSLPTGAGPLSSPPHRPSGVMTATNGSGPPPTYLSRRFVARRISEGETGRLKEELKCQACGKGYKHISSLAKHLWEHTPEWSMTSKLLISKHQQVQLLEAASILVSLNENDEEETKDEEAAAAAAATTAYLAKQHQQQLQINNRRKSMSHPKPMESISGDDTSGDPFKSPFTSPSIDNSSTPSPPPQPLTPSYSNQSHQPSRSAQLSISEQTANKSSELSSLGRAHSRSSSLTTSSAIASTPPTMASNSIITDSLYPATYNSFNGGNKNPDLFPGLTASLTRPSRYDDLVSNDSVTKRRYSGTRKHSTKSYARRMSALNPPSKVSTKVSLEYDEDDDDENVVVDDLDDGVFGDMD